MTPRNVLVKAIQQTSGAEIKRLRRGLSLSQVQVGGLFGRSNAWVAEIEAGRSQPPIWLTEILSRATGHHLGSLGPVSPGGPNLLEYHSALNVAAIGLRPVLLRREPLEQAIVGSLAIKLASALPAGITDFNQVRVEHLPGVDQTLFAEALGRLVKEENVFDLAAGAQHLIDHAQSLGECVDDCREDWAKILHEALSG